MYQLLEDGGVIKLATNQNIPNDLRNSDRQEFEEWVLLGNIPTPADPKVPLTIDEEFDAQDPWVKEIARAAFPNLQVLKAQILAGRP